MATTLNGTPYVESSDLVANYPAISLALANKVDSFAKIRQVVRATDATRRTTTSLSYVDVTGMSVTITPQKSTSAIIIACFFIGNIANATTNTSAGNFRLADSSNNAISGAQDELFGLVNFTRVGGTSEIYLPLAIWGYATPATTSATTYKMRFNSGDAGATVRVLNDVTTGQLYAIEVSA